MQVSVENSGTLERRVKVIVPAEQVEKAFDQRIQKLARTAKIKGFRPGKAPLHFIKDQYGSSVRQEVITETMKSSLHEAMAQEKLSPAGVPVVEPKSVVPGQPLEFVAVFEVLPVITDIKFENVRIEKVTAKIGDADINEVVERIRKQYSKWKKVDRAAHDGDQVIADFRGMLQGQAFDGGTAKNFKIILGSKSMIPGFEEGFIGLKSGEEKVIDVTFPKNYQATNLAGKLAQFEIKVHEVLEAQLPELDNDFVKKLGIKSGNLEELRTEIKTNLEREKNRVTRARLRSQVFAELQKQNTIEIPKALVEKEAHTLHEMEHGAHEHHHDHSHDDEHMRRFYEVAKERVTLWLLGTELMKRHELKVDNERVRTYITDLAAAYENSDEIIEHYYQNQKKLSAVEIEVMEDLLTEKLLEQAKVTEKVVSYHELLQGTDN